MNKFIPDKMTMIHRIAIVYLLNIIEGRMVLDDDDVFIFGAGVIRTCIVNISKSKNDNIRGR